MISEAKSEIELAYIFLEQCFARKIMVKLLVKEKQ